MFSSPLSPGDTPLHLACRLNRAHAAELLVRAGGQLHVRNKEGLSPADVAKPLMLYNLNKILKALSGAKAYM